MASETSAAESSDLESVIDWGNWTVEQRRSVRPNKKRAKTGEKKPVQRVISFDGYDFIFFLKFRTHEPLKSKE
jgi:hypothetical protein